MSPIQPSGKSQALPVLADAIPVKLKGSSQFVVWRYVEEVDQETGEIDWDKPPANARTGGLASSTNPTTWCDWDTAWSAYQSGRWDGVGFVLCRRKENIEPGLVAIDLDQCRNPATGAVEAWARQIVDELVRLQVLILG